MSTVTDAMRNHHAELVERLTAQVTAIEERRADADPKALASFLKSELMPHAEGEERALYPALDPVVKAHGTPTATMSVDHEFIGAYVRQIDELANALAKASDAERPALETRLDRIAVQLEGLFRVHLEKEERIYLPLFDKYVSPQDQQHVLASMHEGGEAEHSTASELAGVTQTLDVREVPPARRHPMIFGVFEALKPGTAFLLVNDHDPKPLYYQLNFEHKGELVWEYVEEGPEVWRVRVGKGA